VPYGTDVLQNITILLYLIDIYTLYGRRRNLLALELNEFVLDAKFLALQIVNRRLVGQGPLGFLIDGAFERCVLFFERLDAILLRHAVSPREGQGDRS
jgi:hypothetical protein